MPKHYYTDEEIRELFTLNNSDPVEFARYIAELCAQSVGQTSPEACAKIQDVWQQSETLEKIYAPANRYEVKCAVEAAGELYPRTVQVKARPGDDIGRIATVRVAILERVPMPCVSVVTVAKLD